MRQALIVAAILTLLGIPAAYLSADWNGKLVTHVAEAPAAAADAADDSVANAVDWLAAGVAGIEAKGKDAEGETRLTLNPASHPGTVASGTAVAAAAETPAPGGRGGLLTRGVHAGAASTPETRVGIERGRAAAFAFAKYKLAVDPEDPAALYALARYYREAGNAPEMAANALRYTLAAANTGNMRAARDLGEMYRDGIGVSANPVVAYAWFTVASLGSSEGVDREAVLAERAALAETMTAAEVAEGQSKVAAYGAGHTALAEPAPGIVLIGG